MSRTSWSFERRTDGWKTHHALQVDLPRGQLVPGTQKKPINSFPWPRDASMTCPSPPTLDPEKLLRLELEVVSLQQTLQAALLDHQTRVATIHRLQQGLQEAEERAGGGHRGVCQSVARLMSAWTPGKTSACTLPPLEFPLLHTHKHQQVSDRRSLELAEQVLVSEERAVRPAAAGQ